MTRAIVLPGFLAVAILALRAQTDVNEAAWRTLDTAFHSGNLDHRRQALAAIGTIPNTNDRAVKTAEEALQDKDAQVRVAAAEALGQMKAKQAAPALKAALDDRGEVAFAAAKALVNMGDPAGREMLVAVIAGDRKDSPGMLTNAVREARKKIHHPEGLLLMGTEDAAGAMFGPASMGIVAVKDAFKLRGVSGRAAAAAALAKDPEPYAVQLLEWALSDSNWEVRASAAKALGERGNADSVPKLQLGLADTRDAVRTLSAASIIRIEERQGAAATPSGLR
jgi:HEAT repeat protein